jgi:hypothetical protein
VGTLSRAEHYQKLALKYHDLGKSARPTYLGDFYRGVAVRYALMAQEASERTKKEIVRAEHRFSRQLESDLARLATPTSETPQEAQ